MDLFLQAIAVFFSAAIVENMVLARALGLSRTSVVLEDRSLVTVFSTTVIFLCTVGSVLGYGIIWVMDALLPTAPGFARQAALFLAVILAYLLMFLLVHKLRPGLEYLFNGIVSYAAFSCAVYGTLLVGYAKDLDFPLTLIHGFGSGCGMILAALLILCGHRRMNQSDLPRPFRNMPATLIYLGILALVLYGLVGHNLPT